MSQSYLQNRFGEADTPVGQAGCANHHGAAVLNPTAEISDRGSVCDNIVE